MAKKQKEPTIIEFQRANLAQLDIDLDTFIGKCQQLNSEDPKALEDLKSYVTEFADDVKHYIKNFIMTDGILNIGKDGKLALRGNKHFAEEQEFFLEHAVEKDASIKKPFIPYKAFARKIRIENERRNKVGETPLRDIASVTYEGWKSKYKEFIVISDI
jgi:hypothetical protein